MRRHLQETESLIVAVFLSLEQLIDVFHRMKNEIIVNIIV